LPLLEKCKNSKEFKYADLHAAKCLYYSGKKELAKNYLNKFIDLTKDEQLKKIGLDLKREIAQA